MRVGSARRHEWSAATSANSSTTACLSAGRLVSAFVPQDDLEVLKPEAQGPTLPLEQPCQALHICSFKQPLQSKWVQIREILVSDPRCPHQATQRVVREPPCVMLGNTSGEIV